MSDGKLFKADRDYSKDVDKLLPEAEKLAQASFNFMPLGRSFPNH